MRPNSFFLYLYGFPDSAPTTITQVAQGFYINIPILWCFGAQTSCIAITSILICILVLFRSLLLYHLHERNKNEGRKPRHTYKLLSMMADHDHKHEEVTKNSRTVTDVIILSGQSNMSGRGGVHTRHHKDGSIYKEWDHVIPPACHVADEDAVLRLNAKLEWVKACEPLHQDIDRGKVCGIGPGLVFAASVLAASDNSMTMGLVPCAVGGTQIKEWEKGSKLYEQMIERAKAAIRESGTIKALLWYQGESDTLSSANVKEFPRRLEALITNVRSDLQIDDLPVIQVGITAEKHPFPEFLEEVRRAQREVEAKLSGVYYVDAHGLSLLEDNLHLNMNSQVQLGKMLADIYMQRIATSCELS